MPGNSKSREAGLCLRSLVERTDGEVGEIDTYFFVPEDGNKEQIKVCLPSIESAVRFGRGMGIMTPPVIRVHAAG